MVKFDNTCKPETWKEAGGVYCVECQYFQPQSLFSMYPACLKNRWNMTMRNGVIMTGCNQGKSIL